MRAAGPGGAGVTADTCPGAGVTADTFPGAGVMAGAAPAVVAGMAAGGAAAGGAAPAQRVISAEELASHSSEADVWVALYGKVR